MRRSRRLGKIFTSRLSSFLRRRESILNNARMDLCLRKDDLFRGPWPRTETRAPGLTVCKLHKEDRSHEASRTPRQSALEQDGSRAAGRPQADQQGERAAPFAASCGAQRAAAEPPTLARLRRYWSPVTGHRSRITLSRRRRLVQPHVLIRLRPAERLDVR